MVALQQIIIGCRYAGGASFYEACYEACEIAARERKIVTFKFNNKIYTVQPEDLFKQVKEREPNFYGAPQD